MYVNILLVNTRWWEDRFKIHSSKPEGTGNSCFMKKVSLFYMKSEPKLLDVFLLWLICFTDKIFIFAN